MNISFRARYVVILFLLSTTCCWAQFDSLGINTPWCNGTIVLKNNSTLKGLIQLNDKLGIINFKEVPSDVVESFVATSISSMQFYDEEKARRRNFATFNVTLVDEPWTGNLLFEMLMEFKNFALMSRTARANAAVRDRSDSRTGQNWQARVGYEQFETFYLINADAEAVAVLAVNEFERNKMSLASKDPAYLNKKAIEKYLMDDWEKFQTIVKDEKLDLKKKEEFLKAFDLLRQSRK